MSVESTQQVMMKYINGKHKDVSMLAEDVVYTMMANGQESHTPQGVLQMLDYFYHVAFEAAPEGDNVIIGDGKAMIESIIVGKHIGEFAGVPATGKEIRVPICIVYDLENDQIKRARIYFEMPVLMQQLGVPMGAGAAQATE